MYYIFGDKCFDQNKNQLIGNITTKHISYSKLNLDNVAITNVDTILLFQNRWDGNFRHFMIETFHLLSCLFSNNVDKNTIKIMINKNYCKHSYQILEILKLTQNIIFREPNHLYQCNHLIWSNTTTNFNNPHYKLLLKTLINNSKQMSHVPRYDNIYLSREHIDIFTKTHTPKRWITNQQQATKVFYQHNYQKVQVDNLDFWDQVAIINNAKKIITFIGANCENIAFTNNQAKFSILYAPNQSWWANAYNYSNSLHKIQCSNRDNSVVYKPSWGADDHLNGPYLVNIDILKKNI